MRTKIFSCVAVAIFALLWLPIKAQVKSQVIDPVKPKMTKVENQDLMGSDYKYFDLKPGETCQTCIDACLKDPNCKAYTFTKPGFQAPNGRCYLKSAVPKPSANTNCISGIKNYTNSNTAPVLINKPNTQTDKPNMNIKNIENDPDDEDPPIQMNEPDTIIRR
jgi:hypothetical protein